MTSNTRKQTTGSSTTDAPAVGGRSTGDGARLPRERASATRWWLAGVAAAVVLAGIAGGVYMLSATGDGAGSAAATPYVGGDLHVLASLDGNLYVGGHDGAAISRDGGQSWVGLESLRGADPMGWARTPGGLLVGGHPGLYRSSGASMNFTKVSTGGAVSDVHAVGAAGDAAYLASPQTGLMASDDGGRTWQPRNTQVGQGFMGTILVDPGDPQRLIAPDMSNGLVASSDGGATWARLGGPDGAMSAAWDPNDADRMVAIGMADSAISDNGGRSWTPLQVPSGTSAANFSADGRTLYAAVLDDERVTTFASTDSGQTWTRP